MPKRLDRARWYAAAMSQLKGLATPIAHFLRQEATRRNLRTLEEIGLRRELKLNVVGIWDRGVFETAPPARSPTVG